MAEPTDLERARYKLLRLKMEYRRRVEEILWDYNDRRGRTGSYRVTKYNPGKGTEMGNMLIDIELAELGVKQLEEQETHHE